MARAEPALVNRAAAGGSVPITISAGVAAQTPDGAQHGSLAASESPAR